MHQELLLQLLDSFLQRRQFLLPNTKSPPPLGFLLKHRPLPSPGRIIDGRFATDENANIVQSSPGQTATDSGHPATPEPPAIMVGEGGFAVTGHKSHETGAKVSDWVKTSKIWSARVLINYKGWEPYPPVLNPKHIHKA